MNRRATRRRASRRERGVAAILVALLLVPLLAFAGLAVDLGGWYARAAQVQRAADAAALAGVTKLVEGTAPAEAEARRVATLNGFTDGVDNISVDVHPIPSLEQLQVVITDHDVPQYLTRLFRPSVAIARQGQAEQVLPVPMGSPRNYLGTGDLLSGSANDEHLFAAISGYCASREQGDRIMPRTDASFTTANNPPPGGGNPFASCSAGNPGHVVANAEYSSAGYFYAIEVPAGYSGNLDIQVFDAPYCQRTNSANNGPRDQSGRFTTRFQVRDNDSLDPLTATVLSTVDLPGNDMGSGTCATPDTDATSANGAECSSGEWGNCWRTLRTLPSPVEPGIYYVQVQALAPSSFTTQEGTNGFGLRTRTNGFFTPCSADPYSSSPPPSATCPNVYAVQHLGLFARIGGAGEFFLADVGPQHNGKTMELTLWDTGEGAQNLRIVDPLGGTSYAFTWEVLCQDGSDAPCPGETAPRGGYGPFSNQTMISNLDDSGAPQPGAHRLSSYRYNDRLIRVRLQLPNDIDAAFSGRTWWRIRYQAGAGATDRTTWSVRITGDPVRLVPNT